MFHNIRKKYSLTFSSTPWEGSLRSWLYFPDLEWVSRRAPAQIRKVQLTQQGRIWRSKQEEAGKTHELCDIMSTEIKY